MATTKSSANVMLRRVGETKPAIPIPFRGEKKGRSGRAVPSPMLPRSPLGSETHGCRHTIGCRVVPGRADIIESPEIQRVKRRPFVENIASPDGDFIIVVRAESERGTGIGNAQRRTRRRVDEILDLVRRNSVADEIGGRFLRLVHLVLPGIAGAEVETTEAEVAAIIGADRKLVLHYRNEARVRIVERREHAAYRDEAVVARIFGIDDRTRREY